MVPTWLSYGFSQLGVGEVSGRAANQNIIEYFKNAGFAEIYSDEVPWCAAFLAACLKASQLEGTNSLLARSYLDWGQEISTVQIGAIAVFTRGPDPTFGHVGFVVGQGYDHLLILGGNQDNQVSIKIFPKSRLLGLRWPDEGASGSAQSPLQTDEIFKAALSHVLAFEGGFVHHLKDPGGATNFGITLKSFAMARGQRLTKANYNHLLQALKTISQEEVHQIYHHYYWRKGSCDQLSAPLALFHFDACVNHGPARAIKFLQRAVGVKTDGIIGPATIGAARQMPLADSLRKYKEIRRGFYHSLAHFPTFGRGWIRRLEGVFEIAEHWRDHHFGRRETDPQNHPQHQHHSQHEIEKERKSMTDQPKWWGESLTIWGAIVTALATVLPVIGPVFGFDVSADMIQQFGESVTKILQAIGGVIGTIMTIFGRFRARQPLTRRALNLKL